MSAQSRKGAETRDKKTQILDAATKLLRKRGLQAFSFDAIAGEAGLSRQLVRYYYSTLDDLMVDLCEHLMLVYQEILTTGIVKVGQVGRLEFFLDFFFGAADGHALPDNLEVYDVFFAYAVGSEPLKDRLRELYKTLRHVITHELAVAHPHLNAKAREELSFLFVSMMHAHWSFVATLGYSSDHNRITRQAFDTLIASYVGEERAGSATVQVVPRDG
ncbi:TetR/AcrR family transcriptional regulator [Pelagibacterium montanilacus]|uniref:TetR/AcrR family transcriptional regulator n=1 Tax=Pelagibacterium montanilacus TaxID=2185280 RepID=UPI000F8C7CD6|nr:TetR/AcrR family transcriptional regulator [Pelagibacterium montanilacus]